MWCKGDDKIFIKVNVSCKQIFLLFFIKQWDVFHHHHITFVYVNKPTARLVPYLKTTSKYPYADNPEFPEGPAWQLPSSGTSKPLSRTCWNATPNPCLSTVASCALPVWDSREKWSSTVADISTVRSLGPPLARPLSYSRSSCSANPNCSECSSSRAIQTVSPRGIPCLEFAQK